MNLQLTGHHLEITPALRDYVTSKLARISNHFDHVIDVKVTMSVEKLAQKVEATLHVPGNDLHGNRSCDLHGGRSWYVLDRSHGCIACNLVCDQTF